KLKRLGLQVDHTEYKPSRHQGEQLAFKYYLNEGNIAMVWHESNYLLRLPKHPKIIPLNSLALDTISGEDKVVGYTTPFFRGVTIMKNVSRLFKLKYLKKLIAAVDYLNLSLGIVHGDIWPGNLLINPVTDNL
ncbi:hypothetical protein BJ875DRAFT_514070, partial [Amylocarpus encephaloides]